MIRRLAAVSLLIVSDVVYEAALLLDMAAQVVAGGEC